MRNTPRGFTLIELMMTVGIIGILSSVAIPNFIAYQLRSRATERAVISRSIHESVTLLWVREDRFPGDAGSGQTVLDCPQNPPGNPGTAKRRFDITLGDWAKLSAPIEGAVYYTYQVRGQAGNGDRWHTITSKGDLDGDGDLALLVRHYEYENGGLKTFSESDTADDGKF